MLNTLTLVMTFFVVTPVESGCESDTETAVLAQKIINHKQQERKHISCHQGLFDIAQERAKQIATGTTPNDLTPNHFLVQKGYRMPNYYPIHGNQVEAIAQASHVDVALKYLVESDKHQQHILGKGEFFSLQTQIGVGKYKNGNAEDQWVVLIASPWEPPKFTYKAQTPKALNVPDICESGGEQSDSTYLQRKCRKKDHVRKRKNK